MQDSQNGLRSGWHEDDHSFVPPLVVTIITPDGRSRSARIEIEAAHMVM
jgi:hypothetical protein